MLASALSDTTATEATTATTTSSTKTTGVTAAVTNSSSSEDIIFERCTEKNVQEIFFGWALTEHWNPATKGADILAAFFKIDTEGFFIGKVPKKDGSGEFETVSIVSGVRYGDEQAWVGFYIVAPEHRGKGYGLKSFQNVMKHVDATSKEGQARPSIGLDGVLAQVDNYRRSGFTEVAWQSERRHGSATELVHTLERDLAEKISRDEIPGLVDLIIREKQVQRHEAKRDEKQAGVSSSLSSVATATTTNTTAGTTAAEKEANKRNESFLGLKSEALVGSDFQDAVESAFSVATTALSFATPSSSVPKLADWKQLSPLEQRFAGLKRPEFVQEWVRFHADHPEEHRFTAAVLSQDQKDPKTGLPVVLGFGCIRPAESSYRLGPLYASTPEIAKQLLVKLSCDIVQAEKIKPLGVPLEIDIDVPDKNTEAIKLFDEIGWPNTFPLLRMWKGKVPEHDVRGVFGVTTLEVG